MKSLGLMLACGVLLVVCLLRDRKERNERSEAEAEQARQRIREEMRDALLERVHQANQEWLERNERFLHDLMQEPSKPRVQVLESGIVAVRASCEEEAAEIVSQSEAFAWRSA